MAKVDTVEGMVRRDLERRVATLAGKRRAAEAAIIEDSNSRWALVDRLIEAYAADDVAGLIAGALASEAPILELVEKLQRRCLLVLTSATGSHSTSRGDNAIRETTVSLVVELMRDLEMFATEIREA